MAFTGGKTLTNKQILEVLAKGHECGADQVKLGFCWNSRRWTIMMIDRTPESCTYPNAFKGCEGCGYFEERKPTKYILDSLRWLGFGVEVDR